MVIATIILLFTISILLIYIGRQLHQIKGILFAGKKQLEEYLSVVCESAYQGEDTEDYQVTNEEKQMLWTSEEKEKLFNEVLQEIFQQ